jgi:hypothetical protein
MMKRLIGAILVGILLGGTVASGSGLQGRGKKHGAADHAKHDKKQSDSHVSLHLVFGKADVVILRDHYSPRYTNLPPGLQKKVARGGPLPPGWRKKFEPFPASLERRLPPLPAGYGRGVIDGHAVIYNSRTSVIVDVAVLF